MCGFLRLEVVCWRLVLFGGEVGASAAVEEFAGDVDSEEDQQDTEAGED